MIKVKKLGKLRYNIWFYFVLLTLVTVALFWLSEVVLFDYVYQNKKYNDLVDNGKKICAEFNTDKKTTQSDYNAWINDAVSMSEDGYSLYLARHDGENLTLMVTLYGYFGGVEQSVDDFSDEERKIVTKGIENYRSGSADYEAFTYDYNGDGARKNSTSYYVFCSKVKNEAFGEVYVIVSTGQQSLISTLGSIRLQMLIVTAVVFVVSVIFSMYISTRLARPVNEMSRTAKKWAEGDKNVTFVASDYDEITELADALNYAKEGISKTGKMQSDLLANVSHDLKTPLTMIKAYAETIRDVAGNNKEKRDAFANVIIDESDRLTMLVNDILDLSKLQSDIDGLNLSRVDLSELLGRVLTRFNEFVKKDGYTLITDIEPNLYSKVDGKKIEQVFYNLIGNSINYTGEDKTVEVTLKRKGDKIVFETIDSGDGIPEDKVETIWEKYYSGSETHTRPVKGTGLGLSIVKTILKNHNLKFGVISKTGVGSNFFIEFNGDENE